MTTATLRIPVRFALIQAPPHPAHGVEVLASIRLDTLADALNAMEHDDTDPGEKRMNADQCRDALLREMLGGWRWPELVLARIPAIVEMQDGYSEIRRRLVKADNELAELRPLEMLAARVDAPILDQAIEKICAQADEIATLRRERDEARAEQLRFLDSLAGAYADDCPAHELVKRMSPDVLALFAKDALALVYLADAIKLGVEWERGHRMAKDARDQITTPNPGAQP